MSNLDSNELDKINVSGHGVFSQYLNIGDI